MVGKKRQEREEDRQRQMRRMKVFRDLMEAKRERTCSRPKIDAK